MYNPFIDWTKQMENNKTEANQQIDQMIKYLY